MRIRMQEKTLSFGTDAPWTTGACPIITNDIYTGETYDARLEQRDWLITDGASTWPKAVAGKPPPQVVGATLSPELMEPIRALSLRVPEFVTRTAMGSTILDFGQNIAGWLRLSLRACSLGSTVTVRHAEFLYSNRSALYVGNLRAARATDVYICRGGAVRHEPRFTYHGFRFAEIIVTGDVDWSWADQRARVVHSDVKSRSSLRMANDVLTKVQEAIRWTQVDNLHSVPTDCPQRDERQGWMADASVSAEQAVLNFDMRRFYLNWLQVIVDAQQSTYARDCDITVPGGGINGTCFGAVTDTSPHPAGVYGHRPADPSWGAALPLLVDLVNRYYGEDDAVQFVPALHAWAEFLLSMRQNGTVKYHYYGDWLQPGKVASDPIVSEMSAGFNSILAVKIASTLGDSASRSRFASELADMVKVFEATYWNPQVSAFGDGTQAPQVFALYLGGLDTTHEGLALKRLLDLLERDCIGTGIIATKWLFPVLSRYNRTSLGLRLASGTGFPSWGYMVANGATTIWEHWDAYHNPSGDVMSSHNHPAFTSIGAWFFTDLVGLRVDRLPIELGTTLDAYDPLLPKASGEIWLTSGLARVSWEMTPGRGACVNGTCPEECSVRVPLNSWNVVEALTHLQSQGLRAEVCGAAVCVRRPAGPFTIQLSENGALFI